MISSTPLAEEFWKHGRWEACPIIDVHGHMGPFFGAYMPRCDPEAMIRTMDSAGVKLLLFSHHAALFSPDLGNRASIDAVKRYPTRFRAYMVINPSYPVEGEKDLDLFDSQRDVFVGLKFLPDYHGRSLASEGYRAAWEFADKRKLIVLTHTWGNSELDGPRQVEICAERYPGVRLLLGHSLSGEWDKAVELAKRFPNLFLELTAVLDDRGVLEKFVGEVGSTRMLFGTDLPWFDPHQGIGALLSAKMSNKDRHNILHGNAEQLLADRSTTWDV